MTRVVTAALVAALLAGCAGLNKPSPNTPAASGPTLTASADILERWNQHRDRLAPIAHWDLKAKIGVKAGNTGESGSLNWQRSNDDHSIDIYGPLGRGRVMLELTPTGASITDKKNGTRKAASATALFDEMVGWPVPFDEMVHWIRGLPAPGAVTEHVFLPEGVLKSIVQNGWRVEFSEYRLWRGVLLPRRLRIASLPGIVQITDGKGNIAEELIVKFVAKQWEPGVKPSS